MKLRYLSYLLPILAVACTSETVCTDPIGLRAEFGSSFGTKAAVAANPYTETEPSSGKPLEADIWFSTTKDTYKGGVNPPLDFSSFDVHTTITYLGPAITIPQPYSDGNYLHYPREHGKVYCVGLYPQGKWTASEDGKTATAAINGIDDLMYADQKEGSDDNSLSKTPQVYNHELTWLKIRVNGVSGVAAETWGKIKKISVKSETAAKVTFGTDKIEYSGEGYIVAYEPAGGTVIPTTSTEVGSILVSPTNSSFYTVKIECENYSKEVNVTLTDNDGDPFSGETTGKVFVLSLVFQALPTIEHTATLSGWKVDGSILFME